MEWFTDIFLKSFGSCKGKRITEKQANIFRRYLTEEKEAGNTVYISGEVDGKRISLQDSLEYAGSKYGKHGRRTIYKHEYYLTIQ